MIQMTEKEYLQLKADSELLQRLYANGVDNWIGYEDCVEEEEDFLTGATCNPNAPEECESCQ